MIRPEKKNGCLSLRPTKQIGFWLGVNFGVVKFILVPFQVTTRIGKRDLEGKFLPHQPSI